MRDSLRKILKDRPFWIAVVLFGLLLTHIVGWLTPDPRSANDQIREILGRLSAGEHLEIPMGSGETMPVDPILDENGRPIDLLGLMDAATRSMPGRLAELEEKHGPDDDRAIAMRSGLVAMRMFEGQDQEAAELAERNLSIALGSQSASAASKLKAVDSVVASMPEVPSRTRLSGLLDITDRYASQAPEEAIEAYVSIGIKQRNAGWRKEAEKTLGAALRLADTTGTNSVLLITAHLGVSDLARKRRDCKTAVSALDAALELMDRGEHTPAFRRYIMMQKVQPMLRDCKSFKSIEVLVPRFNKWWRQARE